MGNASCRRSTVNLKTYATVGLMLVCFFAPADRLLGAEVTSVNIVGYMQSGDDVVVGEVVEATDNPSVHLEAADRGEIVHNLVPMQGGSPALIFGEYTYTTNAAGHATITGFDRAHSGAVYITNTLGGYPVTGIGSLQSCTNLTSVTIPDSVTSIGLNAFYGCTRLEKIVVDEMNRAYSGSTDGVLFSKDKTQLVCYPRGKAGHCVIPGNVTSVGGGAFSDCTRLTGIAIPGSVTNIGDSAFSGCTGLTSVTIPNSVTEHRDTMHSLRCTSLTSITIPDSVTSIGGGAFSDCTDPRQRHQHRTQGRSAGCTGLDSVTIPDGVRAPSTVNTVAFLRAAMASADSPHSLQSSSPTAFSGCTGLTSVTIPDSVTSIGGGVLWLHRPDQRHDPRQRHQHRGIGRSRAAPA
jgi:hypothetical protein